MDQSILKPQVLNNEDALVLELTHAGTIDTKAVENLVPDDTNSKNNLPVKTSSSDQISCALITPMIV